MNRVSVLQSSLADRTSELEQAQSKLAACEVDLATAQRNFDLTNGDFAAWQQNRDKLEFAKRQVERARVAVAMATENHEACASALSTAEKEQLIERLQAACKLEDYHSDVQEDVSKLLTAIADSRAALVSARATANAIESRFAQLVLATREYQSAKGEPVTDLNAATKAAPVLLQMLEDAGPDSALPQGWWHKTANLVELAWLEPVSCCTPRSRLEDLAILSLDPKHETELARLNAAEEAELKAAGEAQALADTQAAEAEAKRNHAALVKRLRETPDPSPLHPGRMMSDVYKTGSKQVTIPTYGTITIEFFKDPTIRDPKHTIVKAMLEPFDERRHGGIKSVGDPVEREGLRFEVVTCADGSRHVRQIQESKPGLIARTVAKVLDAVSPAPATTSAKPELNEHGWALLPKSALFDEQPRETPTPEETTP